MRVCCSFINWDPEPSASRAHRRLPLLQALSNYSRQELFGQPGWRLLRGHVPCRVFLGGFFPQTLLFLSGNCSGALDVHKLAPSFVCFILSCSEGFSTRKSWQLPGDSWRIPWVELQLQDKDLLCFTAEKLWCRSVKSSTYAGGDNSHGYSAQWGFSYPLAHLNPMGSGTVNSRVRSYSLLFYMFICFY